MGWQVFVTAFAAGFKNKHDFSSSITIRCCQSVIPDLTTVTNFAFYLTDLQGGIGLRVREIIKGMIASGN